MAGKEQYPLQHYDDMNPEITPSEEQVREIFGIYSLPPVAADTDYDRAPRTLDLFQEAFRFRAPAIGRIVHRIAQNLDCWQFKLLPIERATSLTISTLHVHRNITPLDLAPEQAAPKLMEHFTELFTTQLIRHNKGLSLTNDFYKTEPGRRESMYQLGDIGASTTLSLKLAAIQALITCRDAYRDRLLSAPGLRPTAEEQYIAETMNFGLLGTCDKGLYLVNDEAKKIMSTAVPSVSPTMAIFSSGDLSLIALNSERETDYSKSGNDSSGKNISQARLMHAGSSFKVAGVEIFQDEPYQIASLYSGSFEPLVRTVQIGRSFTVSPHRYFGLPNVDFSKAMSFEYWNVKKDAFTLFSSNDLLYKCCRWGPNGNLREEHWALCDLYRGSPHGGGGGRGGGGLGPGKWGSLDPYIYRDGDGYSVCESVGDMEPSTLEDSFVRNWGDVFRAKCTAEVGDGVGAHLDTLSDIASKLYNCDVDDRFQNFVAAVLLMRENQPPEAQETDGAPEAKWVGHTFGAPYIPYRDPRTSFLYTSEPTHPDKDWLDSPVVLVRSKATGAIVGYRVYRFGVPGGSSIPTGPPGERVLTKMIPVSESGAPGVEVDIGASDYTYERCPSNDKPYGYCDYPSLCYLAALGSSGNTRGWCKETLDSISKSVTGFRTHFDIVRRVFPGNMAFNESNVPDFLYTGDADLDAASAYFHNDFLRGEHRGLVGRRPIRQDGDLALSLSPSYDSPDPDAGIQASYAWTNKLYEAMGGGGGTAKDVSLAMISYITSRVKPHLLKSLEDKAGEVFGTYQASGLATAAASNFEGSDRSFGWFFNRFIVSWYSEKMVENPDDSQAYLDQCVNLFQAILNAALNGVSTAKVTSAEDFQTLVQGYRFAQEAALSQGQRPKTSGSRGLEKVLRALLSVHLQEQGQRPSVVNRVRAGVTKQAYVSTLSTRLSLNPKCFRSMSANPVALVALVAWPSSPLHTLEPFTEWPLELQQNRGEDITAAFEAAESKKAKHGMGARRIQSSSHKRKDTFHGGEPMYAGAKARKTAVGRHPAWGGRGPQGYDYALDQDGEGFTAPSPSYSSFGAPTGPSRGPRDGPQRPPPHPWAPPGAISYSRIAQGGDLFSGKSVIDDWNDRDAWASDGLPIRYNLVQALQKAMVSTLNTTGRLGAQLFVQSRVCLKQYETWLNEKLPIPDSYTYAAPFEELSMGSAVYADSNNAGRTYFGWEDMSMQLEVTHKTWIGHFNCHMGASVTNPAKICVIPNVSFKKVVKGFDGSVCTEENDFVPERPRQKQQKVGFVFSHGPRFTPDDVPTPFWTLQGKIDEKKFRTSQDRSEIRWPGDVYYNYLWGFSRMNESSVLDYSSITASVHSTHVNTTLSQGRQKNYDPATGGYGTPGYVIKGTGHLRNWEAPSILAVLSGKKMAVEPST